MDFDPATDLLYYGDRDSARIFSVSVNRITNLQDDRALLMTNVTAWGISYDWIHGYLYWTDDRYVLVLQVCMCASIYCTYHSVSNYMNFDFT